MLTFRMTLVEAVQSLQIIELPSVSFINIYPIETRYVGVFTIALLLPFADQSLSEEFRSGQLSFWPDQRRFLESTIPIQDQILELHLAQILGNLNSVHLKGPEGKADRLWIIETHAGSREERLAWLKSVIEMEGRSPVDEA